MRQRRLVYILKASESKTLEFPQHVEWGDQSTEQGTIEGIQREIRSKAWVEPILGKTPLEYSGLLSNFSLITHISVKTYIFSLAVES